MATDSVFDLGSREGAVQARSVLDDIVREGARRLLQAALEAEVAEQLARFRNVVDTAGRQTVVRNGHLPERELMTGVGPLPVKQPESARPQRSDALYQQDSARRFCGVCPASML